MEEKYREGVRLGFERGGVMGELGIGVWVGVVGRRSKGWIIVGGGGVCRGV